MSGLRGPCGPTILSVDDMARLQELLRTGQPKQEATDAATRGAAMLAQFERDNHCIVRSKDATLEELKDYVFRKHRHLFSKLAKS